MAAGPFQYSVQIGTSTMPKPARSFFVLAYGPSWKLAARPWRELLALNECEKVSVEAVFFGDKESVRGARIHFESATGDCLRGPSSSQINGGSASPWMIKVGTVKAAMSFRRSVSDIARIMSVIAFGEAGKNNPTDQ